MPNSQGESEIISEDEQKTLFLSALEEKLELNELHENGFDTQLDNIRRIMKDNLDGLWKKLKENAFPSPDNSQGLTKHQFEEKLRSDEDLWFQTSEEYFKEIFSGISDDDLSRSPEGIIIKDLPFEREEFLDTLFDDQKRLKFIFIVAFEKELKLKEALQAARYKEEYQKVRAVLEGRWDDFSELLKKKDVPAPKAKSDKKKIRAWVKEQKALLVPMAGKFYGRIFANPQDSKIPESPAFDYKTLIDPFKEYLKKDLEAEEDRKANLASRNVVLTEECRKDYKAIFTDLSQALDRDFKNFTHSSEALRETTRHDTKKFTAMHEGLEKLRTGCAQLNTLVKNSLKADSFPLSDEESGKVMEAYKSYSKTLTWMFRTTDIYLDYKKDNLHRAGLFRSDLGTDRFDAARGLLTDLKTAGRDHLNKLEELRTRNKWYTDLRACNRKEKELLDHHACIGKLPSEKREQLLKTLKDNVIGHRFSKASYIQLKAMAALESAHKKYSLGDLELSALIAGQDPKVDLVCELYGDEKVTGLEQMAVVEKLAAGVTNTLQGIDFLTDQQLLEKKRNLKLPDAPEVFKKRAEALVNKKLAAAFNSRRAFESMTKLPQDPPKAAAEHRIIK